MLLNQWVPRLQMTLGTFMDFFKNVVQLIVACKKSLNFLIKCTTSTYPMATNEQLKVNFITKT